MRRPHNIYIDEQLMSDLHIVATIQGTSRSAIIETLIGQYLEGQDMEAIREANAALMKLSVAAGEGADSNE